MLLARVTGNRGGSPGPGAYSIRTAIGDAPKYTLKSRHSVAERPTTAPYRALPSAVGEGPKASLASRHRGRAAESTPGPSYVPPAFGASAQRSALASRHGPGRDPRRDDPGPGAYTVRPLFANEASKFTLHQRTGRRADEPVSPGPAAYSPTVDAARPRAPAAAMHIRPQARGADATPGYVNLGSTLTRPRITIGRRETLDLIPV
jgi:hypothetical protein